MFQKGAGFLCFETILVFFLRVLSGIFVTLKSCEQITTKFYKNMELPWLAVKPKGCQNRFHDFLADLWAAPA
jgi:hypothetical protein